MFHVTQDEYNEIMTILFENCSCGTPFYDCSDSTCDIYKIGEILDRHVVMKCSEEEEEYDELPF